MGVVRDRDTPLACQKLTNVSIFPQSEQTKRLRGDGSSSPAKRMSKQLNRPHCDQPTAVSQWPPTGARTVTVTTN